MRRKRVSPVTHREACRTKYDGREERSRQGEGNGEEGRAYALAGDEVAALAVAPLGLPLAARCDVAATVVPEEAGAMRSAEGECATEVAVEAVAGGGGRSAGVANEGRSWGAGEGAMAMAVLMAGEMRNVIARRGKGCRRRP